MQPRQPKYEDSKNDNSKTTSDLKGYTQVLYQSCLNKAGSPLYYNQKYLQILCSVGFKSKLSLSPMETPSSSLPSQVLYPLLWGTAVSVGKLLLRNTKLSSFV